MIVVADTSPLNYLIRLGLPEVLRKIYGRILVPGAVLTELRHPEAPSEVRAWAAELPAWVEMLPAHRLDPALPAALGAGEREAISLALEVQANLLLIDQFAGLKEAEARNIAVAGTLAVLLKASLLDLAEFPQAVLELSEFGFRVSRQVRALMMARYLEERKSNAKDGPAA